MYCVINEFKAQANKVRRPQFPGSTKQFVQKCVFNTDETTVITKVLKNAI